MKVVILFILAIGILFLRFYWYFSHIPHYNNGQIVDLQVTLSEEPVASNQGQQFSITDSQNRRISIHSSLNELYHYGDRLAIRGKLQARIVAKNRDVYSLFYPKITKLPEAKDPLSKASIAIRNTSSRLFQETLPPIAASLLSGIVFGSKEDFSKDFFQDLRNCGVLHVIAASGMNVTFFTSAVMFSLGTFFTRRLSLLLSIFAAFFYSFLVGFQPSILRATLMAIIVFTASFFGRQSLALGTLIVTGLAMLLWQPAYLFDVGFQLSFLATLGILVVGRQLEHIFWLNKLGSLKEDFVTTVAAEIATTPILLSTFGSVGMLSILVNMLVLWTVPLLMLLGSMAVVMGLIFAPLAKLLLLLCLPLLLFFQSVITFFGGLGWNFTLTHFSWQDAVGYYCLVGAGLWFLSKKQGNE